MLIFAVCSSLLPFTLYLWGLKYLDPTRAVVTGCLEPVFAVVIAAVTLDEGMRAVQIVGIGVVLLATILIQLPEKAKPAAPSAE
jgi:drug/metabolite transporter (DMT)-like permease